MHTETGCGMHTGGVLRNSTLSRHKSHVHVDHEKSPIRTFHCTSFGAMTTNDFAAGSELISLNATSPSFTIFSVVRSHFSARNFDNGSACWNLQANTQEQ